MSTESQCLTLRQSLNATSNDYASQCSRQNLTDKTNGTIGEFQTFVDEQTRLLDGERSVFDNLLQTLLLSDKTQTPITDYNKELQQQKASLEAENYQLQQSIRAGRRRFMDADPQSGVTSIAGLRTTDDKIMLTFWVSYAFAIMVFLFIIVSLYGEIIGLDTRNKKLGFGTAVFIFLYGVAYFAIYRYA